MREPVNIAHMFSKADIEKYFLGEKSLSLIFMILGGVAILAAIVFFFVIKTNMYKGAAIPLIVIGILQLTAAYTVYNRSDKDRTSLVYAYDMNPPLLKDKELPRMEKVNSNFKILIFVEIAFIIIGAGLFLYWRNDNSKALWVGVGMALAAEGIITLIADATAKKRADTYTQGLRQFTEKGR